MRDLASLTRLFESRLDHTTVTAPIIARSIPITFRMVKLSPKTRGANTQFAMRATVPKGATTEAGANPYDRKLPASPTAIKPRPNHHNREVRYVPSEASGGVSVPLLEDNGMSVRPPLRSEPGKRDAGRGRVVGVRGST